MAADDAAVVVSLRANLKDYEAALKQAVRITERAATAAEKAISGVGKKASAAPVAEVFSKSASQIANDARVMQFQLNDIFSGLASGQGIRAVQQQLGQIAQQLSGGGGGLAQGARTMGVAIAGMINPINIAVVAFGVLASVAASYFGEGEKGAKTLTDALREQLDVLNRLREAQGLPAASRGHDELDLMVAQADAIKAQADASSLLQKQFDELTEALRKYQIQRRLVATGEEIQGIKELNAAIAELKEGMKNGNPDFLKFLDTISRIGAIQGLPSGMKTMIQTIADLALKAGQAARNVDDLQKALERAQKISTGGTIGPPIPQPGFIQEGKEIMEQARKQREEAERAAKEAAAEAERASKEAKREAERAAEEATKRLNEAIANQTKVAVDAASSLIGKSETANAAEINSFLRRGGVDLDAATTAWCAAFVNSALAQVGIKGTGSNVATSFANWGKAVDLSQIQRGDVLVQQRGRAPGDTGGHVGFATGQLRVTAEGISQIEMLSGNASNQVETDWVNASEVIARRAGEAFQVPAEALQNLTEESKKAAKEAQDQARAAQQFSQQIAGMAQSAIGGLVNDLRNGVEAGEAFKNMLDRILDSLIQMSIQSLFSPQGLGGIFGNLLGAPAAEKGGIVGQSSFPRRMVDPRVFVGAKHFARGGIVGGEVPIIAHRGEMIVPRNQVGGIGRTNVNNTLGPVSIDMSSTGMVAAGTDQARQFGENVRRIIAVEMMRESRPGGLLRSQPGAR
jgi:uncharacterized protein (TIGR02594 family)